MYLIHCDSHHMQIGAADRLGYMGWGYASRMKAPAALTLFSQFNGDTLIRIVPGRLRGATLRRRFAQNGASVHSPCEQVCEER